MMENLLTAEQVAQKLGIKVKTIYQWTYEGFIPNLKLGRLVRFDPKEIERWAQKCARKGRLTRSIDLKDLCR